MKAGVVKGSVLIAEDDEELRLALKLALETQGYSVRLAANGKEALQHQRQDPAAILLTDIFMPDADGFEAIDGFHREFPQTKIVAMSGEPRGMREYLSVAALIGVDATLKKPFKMDALLQVLQSL